MRERTVRGIMPAVAVLLLGIGPALLDAADLRSYRNIELGSDLAAVTKQTGVDVSGIKTVHSRPALIQELEWRPEYVAGEPDSVKGVVFTFLNGQLCRIVVNYDRRATEGLTVQDLSEKLSETYGPIVKPAEAFAHLPDGYGGSEEIVAQWQDSSYRFDLIRAAYGPSFRLIGTVKKLDALAKAASLEAARLDENEAPQREAARLASEGKADASRLEKVRTLNKPKFRP